MILADVVTAVGGLTEVAQWRRGLSAGGGSLGVTPGVEPFVLAGLPVPVVAVTATGRQAEESVRLLRAEGIDNVGLDLMFAVPGGAIEHDLEKALAEYKNAEPGRGVPQAPADETPGSIASPWDRVRAEIKKRSAKR